MANTTLSDVMVVNRETSSINEYQPLADVKLWISSGMKKPRHKKKCKFSGYRIFVITLYINAMMIKCDEMTDLIELILAMFVRFSCDNYSQSYGGLKLLYYLFQHRHYN